MVIITPTWVSAARVLGSLIGPILTVKLSVTLPLLLVEAAAVGAAELIWATCRVFYTRTRVCLSLTLTSPGGTTKNNSFSIHSLTTYFWSCCITLPLPSLLHKHSPHSGDSSEPSEQSMSWSHTKCLGIHCLFWHMNSFSTSQVLLVYTGNGKEHTAVNGLCWSVSVVFISSIRTQSSKIFHRVIPLTAASLDTLISSIRAVLVSIALPALRHAHVGARTLEGLRTAGLGFWNNIMGKYNIRKSYKYSQMPPLGVGESTFTLLSASNMSLTAFLVLIRPITTVIRAVTHPVGGNAAVVPTFKLGGCAKFVCKGWQRELRILEKLFNLPLSHVFPRAVGSLKGNSLGFLVCFVFSRKGIRWQLYSRLTTVCLISSVLTVILLITGPAHRNATTTGTSKEVDWTFKLPFICKTTQKKHTVEPLTISEKLKAL